MGKVCLLLALMFNSFGFAAAQVQQNTTEDAAVKSPASVETAVHEKAVSQKEIDAIPAAERGAWCLQEKIEYAPAIQAPDGGGVKVEIRMMFLRPDDEPKPILAQNLIRLSRGKMLGVDFNKQYTWVGSTVAIFPEHA